MYMTSYQPGLSTHPVVKRHLVYPVRISAEHHHNDSLFPDISCHINITKKV